MTPAAITGTPEVRHSQKLNQSLAETRPQSDSTRTEAERLEAQRAEERRAQGPALHPVI
jgi:hypothetical protein